MKDDTIRVEIRAAEGGDHAKRLKIRQADMYRAYCSRNGLACITVSDRL
jgi:protein subunit release factor A